MGEKEEAPKVSREVLSFPINPEFRGSCVEEAFLSLSSASLTPSCYWFSDHLTLDRLSQPMGQLEKALEMAQMCPHAHTGAELRTGSEGGISKRYIRESRKPCVGRGYFVVIKVSYLEFLPGTLVNPLELHPLF